MTGVLGATPEDWTHFADTLGYRAHLLPVVSDTSVPINEKSKLAALGKTPSRVLRDGTAAGIPAWTKHEASEQDIARWSGDGRHGICMQARAVRAIDIDIDDHDVAAAVREAVLLHLVGWGLDVDVRRRSGTGKCLMPVRVEGALRKRILKTKHGAIEFLADGQQWIAVGTHTSGKRYEWVDSDGCPLSKPSVFPVLTLEQFEALWAALREQFEAEEFRENEAGMVPTKARTMADSRASGDDLAAWLGENGWGIEWDNDGKLRIRCPFGDEHSSGEEGDGSTVYFPAGTGGFERGHFRCLHAHCAGRKDGDYIARLGYLNDDFEVIEAPPQALAADGTPALRPAGLTVHNRTGLIEPDLRGLVAALRSPSWSGVCVVHDLFDRKTRIRFAQRAVPSAWSPGWLDGFEEFHDSHIPGIILALVARGFEEPGKEKVWMAVQQLEHESRMDSAQSWLGTLTWDGVPRIERFFADYWQCTDDPLPYVGAVGRYFWLALAGRVLWPGVKADMMVVVKGKQGCGKSRGAAACVPEGLYGTMKFDDRVMADSVLYTRGRLLIEFAEMAGLTKRESETVKEFLSNSTDTYRMRFDRVARDWPRRGLFFGTTNEDQYLTDPTGHRRWLPLAMRHGAKVDVDDIERDREQLWAEAAAVLAEHGRSGLVHAAVRAEAMADEHTVHDERVVVEDGFRESVRLVLARPAKDTNADFDSGEVPTLGSGIFRMHDVLTGLGVTPERMDRRVEMRVGAALRALGYVKEHRRVDKVKGMWWSKASAGGVDTADLA